MATSRAFLMYRLSNFLAKFRRILFAVNGNGVLHRSFDQFVFPIR